MTQFLYRILESYGTPSQTDVVPIHALLITDSGSVFPTTIQGSYTRLLIRAANVGKTAWDAQDICDVYNLVMTDVSVNLNIRRIAFMSSSFGVIVQNTFSGSGLNTSNLTLQAG